MTVFAQQQDSIFCVQIMATRNVHLVKAEHIAMTFDSVFVEFGAEYDKIIVPYSNLEECQLMLHTWQRCHKDAFIVRRTKKQVNDMVLLYDNK